MLQWSSIPSSSLVPFKVRRLRRATCVWTNHGLSTAVDPHEFSYSIPFDFEKPDDYSDETIQLFAERYGGAGVGGNGGGVRCGVIGQVQIKGIGRNPLAGETTDYWHKHGAASIQDCIRESIWGELAQAALPFGAVRSLAIVSTGTGFQGTAADTGEKTTVPRALLLRPAAVRPAHFMRSIFYSPSPVMAEAIVSDTVRTRLAIRSMADAISLDSCGATASNEDISQAISEALYTCFRRAASQIAASRAKRIIHGSLIDSNFATDGRWLDFSTITTLSDYGRAVVAPGSLDLWEQHSSVIKCARDLRFYIGKYLPSEVTRTLVNVDDIVTDFLQHLQIAIRLEFMKLAGFTDDDLKFSPRGSLDLLWATIGKIIQACGQLPYLYYGDERHPMPAQTGRYHLPTLLRTCATSVDADELFKRLTCDGLNTALAEALSRSFTSLRDAALKRLPASLRSGARLRMAILGIRANWNLTALYRQQLDSRINKVRHDLSAVPQFIDSEVAYWRAVLEPPQDELVLRPWLTDIDLALVGYELRSSGCRVAPADFGEALASFKLDVAEKKCLLRVAQLN